VKPVIIIAIVIVFVIVGGLVIFSNIENFTSPSIEPIPVESLDNISEDEYEYVLYENGELTIDDFVSVITDPNSTQVAAVEVGFQKPSYETEKILD